MHRYNYWKGMLMNEGYPNDTLQETPVPSGASALSVRSANRLLLITVLALNIVPAVLDRIIPSDWSTVIMYAIMFLSAALMCRKEQISFGKAFRFRNVHGKTLLLCAVITLALQPVAGFIANLTDLLFPSLLDAVEDDLYGHTFLINLVTVAVIPGFCEEFLLRGNAANAYRSTGRIRAAVLLSSLMFGLLHENATQFFYAFVIGIVLGLLFMVTDSIWPGILVHFLNNALSVVEMQIQHSHGEALSNRIFVFSEMNFHDAKSCIFYIVSFVIGLAVLWWCLRGAARSEGQEEMLDRCFKAGGGTARLRTPALVITFFILLLATVTVTGMLFFADDLGLTF